MDTICRNSDLSGGLRLGETEVSNLLFADDIVLLSGSADQLQNMLNSLDKSCNDYGMKISTKKSEVVVFSRRNATCRLKLGDTALNTVNHFKYLGVTLASDGTCELEVTERIKRANAAWMALRSALCANSEASKKVKLNVYKMIVRPIITYGHEIWTKSKPVHSRLQAVEMRILRYLTGNRLNDRVSNDSVRMKLALGDSLIHRVEKSQLRWLGHVVRMPVHRLAKGLWNAELGKGTKRGKLRRAMGRPRNSITTTYFDLLERLGVTKERLPERCSNRSVWRGTVDQLPAQMP
jgi:hypothetical protein